MVWPMVIGAVASLASSAIGAKGAKKAVGLSADAQALANKQNEELFQSVLAEFRVRERETRGILNDVGKAGETGIRNQEIAAKSQSQQNLVSRGLANTTRLESASRKIGTDAQAAIENLKADIAFRKAGILSKEKGELLNFAGSKVITGPNPRDVSRLADRSAQADQNLIGSIGAAGSTFGRIFKNLRGGGGTPADIPSNIGIIR